jgi:hypothetical protein
MVEWDNHTWKLSFSQASIDDDVISWCLEVLGGFSAKLLYLRLSQGAAMTHFKEIWRTKVLSRIKVFLWQLIPRKTAVLGAGCQTQGSVRWTLLSLWQA